jgi:alcohol dehydrogenase (NADP+)
MSKTRAFAALDAKSPLGPFEFERRALRPDDVELEILYCGVCHSDLHQARDEWGGSIFPMVPGHEIVGRVTSVGPAVTRFQVGALAGVGCMVDSCGTCESCKEGLEQYCENGFVGTYNSRERESGAPTYGGYASHIVVRESFALSIDGKLALDAAAPLLCAGITTYSPLRHFGVSAGDRVAVVGLGGLGHMAVKFAAAMGAEVTLITTSESKLADAKRLGAHDAILSRDPKALKKARTRFDFILDTVAAPHDLDVLLSALRRDGTLTLVGVPDKNHPSPSPGNLIFKRRSLSGSLIGGIAETQEMLDFCAEKGIVSDVETIAVPRVNEAYERMLRSDVKYRFVLDLKTLPA